MPENIIKNFCERAAGRLSHLMTGIVESNWIVDENNTTIHSLSEGKEFEVWVDSPALVVRVTGFWNEDSNYPKNLEVDVSEKE